MITLDGFELGEDLVWTDRRKSSPVVQKVRVTIGGGLNTFAEPFTVQRPVTLVALQDQGWLTKAMADQLKIFEAAVNRVFVFNYHNLEILNVMFKHEEPPALELDPLIVGGDNATHGNWFIGTIKLFTV